MNKVYKINLKAKSTSLGDLQVNLTKNQKTCGKKNIPLNIDMAYILSGYDSLQDVLGEETFKKLTEIPKGFCRPSKERTNLESMFSNLSITKADLSDWDTSRITNLNSLFSFNTELETVDLTGWDTSKVDFFGGTFDLCEKLKEIKGCFDLSSIPLEFTRGVEGMFNGCQKELTVQFKNVPKDFFDKVDVGSGRPKMTMPEIMGLTPEQCIVLSYKE